MKKRIVLIPVAIVAILAVAGICYAAFVSRLRVNGQATAVQDAQWQTTPMPVSNDSGSQNDPSGPGASPTRESYDLGSTGVGQANATHLGFTSSNVYDSYSYSVSANIAPNSTPLVVQNITLTNTPPDPALSGTTTFATFTPGTHIQAYLKPGDCGKALSSSANTPLEFQVKFLDVASGAVYGYQAHVELVPASAYVPATCRAWTP